MQNHWIIVSEYCDKCHIEPSFIDLLYEEGLIELPEIEGKRCLTVEELPDVELYSRLHYDLSINMEGIDVIRQLLDRMNGLQQELEEMHRRLRFYGEP